MQSIRYFAACGIMYGVAALLHVANLPEAKPVEVKKNEVWWSSHIAKSWGLDPDKACEVYTPNGSRVDILTDDIAWEVEWAYKWKEAPGQSRFYAAAFNRKPGIVLLFKDKRKEEEYYLSCLVVCKSATPKIKLLTVNTKH